MEFSVCSILRANWQSGCNFIFCNFNYDYAENAKPKLKRKQNPKFESNTVLGLKCKEYNF